MSDLQHHLRLSAADMAGNAGIGRYVLVPGSPARAEYLAGLFDVRERAIITPRHNDTYLGRIRDASGTGFIDVAAVSSGMGTGSTEIVVRELIAAGARRLVRVGTSGAVRYKEVRVGSLVIATGAVRDDATSAHYVPESYPAVAHPDVVQAYSEAARDLGLAERTFRGLVHTKASLYARAMFEGPRGPEHGAFKDVLMRANVLSSEMESSVLFVMATSLSAGVLSLADEPRQPAALIKAGTILGIIGGEDEWASDERIAQIEHDTCVFALKGLAWLARLDRAA